MLALVHQEHLQSIAVLAFDDRFCKRLRLIQLPLFAKLVRPACQTVRGGPRLLDGPRSP